MIISDIHMPGMNGIELLKQVKRLNPNTMVIIVTTYPEITMARETMQLGVCGDTLTG